MHPLLVLTHHEFMGQQWVRPQFSIASSNAAAQALKRISPPAWKLVNYYGRYQFDSYLMSIDMES